MRTNFLMIFPFLLLTLCNSSCFAIDDDIVRVKHISSSGKTLYINRGKFDDVAQGDFGVLLIKKKIDDDKFVYVPVAKIKNVKIFDRESVWITYKVFIENSLKKNKKLIFLSESRMLKGRAPLKMKRTTVVTNPGKRKSEIEDFMLEGDSLAKKKSDYKVVSINHGKEKHFESDIDLIDVDKWDRKLGDEKLFASGFYRSPYAKEFSQRKRVQTFEKMVVAYLNKYNDPNFEYETFYKEQKRSSGGYLSANTVFGTYKDRYDEKLVSEENKKKKLYENLKKKGDAWSENYTDDQLSELLNSMSVIREKERRSNLIAYRFDYQAFVSFGVNLLNNENIEDAETTEQSRYDVELAFEGYFFKDLKSFKKVTLEFSGRRAVDGYFGGDLNVRSTEYSLAAHLNWYPFRRPSTIDANIIYIGLLTRYGFARLSNVTADEIGNYQVFTLPGIRGGVKYNLDNSYGIRLALGYENIRSERIVRNDDDGTLPNRASYKEAKVSIGISKFY